MNGVSVSLCEVCGWRGFPRRVWCPTCGTFELTSAVVHSGCVTEVSILEHAIGRDLPGGVVVANVELDGGGSLIARLESEPKGSVGISVEEGVPVAAASDAL